MAAWGWYLLRYLLALGWIRYIGRWRPPAEQRGSSRIRRPTAVTRCSKRGYQQRSRHRTLPFDTRHEPQKLLVLRAPQQALLPSGQAPAAPAAPLPALHDPKWSRRGFTHHPSVRRLASTHRTPPRRFKAALLSSTHRPFLDTQLPPPRGCRRALSSSHRLLVRTPTQTRQQLLNCNLQQRPRPPHTTQPHPLYLGRRRRHRRQQPPRQAAPPLLRCGTRTTSRACVCWWRTTLR